MVRNCILSISEGIRFSGLNTVERDPPATDIDHRRVLLSGLPKETPVGSISSRSCVDGTTGNGVVGAEADVSKKTL